VEVRNARKAPIAAARAARERWCDKNREDGPDYRHRAAQIIADWIKARA
jgi:hypothetical protein